MGFWANMKEIFWRIDLKVANLPGAFWETVALIGVYIAIELVPFWLLDNYLENLEPGKKGSTAKLWGWRLVRWLMLAPLAYYLFFLAWYGIHRNYWGLAVGALIVVAAAIFKDWRRL